MKWAILVLCALLMTLVVGVACAQSSDTLFITKNGTAIGGVGLGLVILIITAAVAIGKRTSTYDAHITDSDIHTPQAEMQDRFVDKDFCTEQSAIFREARDTALRTEIKVDAITETLRNGSQ